MGKNTEKYRYLDVGLKKLGWTLAQLLEDAELHEMDDQPAKLAGLRLTEYYQLVRRGVIIPGQIMTGGKSRVLGTNPEDADLEETSYEEPAFSVPRLDRRTNHRRLPASEPVPAVEDDRVEESENVAGNAGAALGYFLDEDDE